MSVILIATISHDIHAEAIRHELSKNPATKVLLLEADRLSAEYSLSWTKEGGFIGFPDGNTIDISKIDLIWWRRTATEQSFDVAYDDLAVNDLINRDCNASLLGAFLTHFAGKWISHPKATAHASNKLVQIRAATKCGFMTPETLVSNDPLVVRDFIHDVGSCIVKPVSGTKHALLFTQFVAEYELDDEAIAASPAIYQRFIDGCQHVRLNCFGESSTAAEIATSELDWRTNKNCTYRDYEVPPELQQKVRATLDSLELEMGVVDLKIDASGNMFWLEVNPQGQFLFVEGLTGQQLRRRFATYLAREARQSNLERSSVQHIA